jgi:hypothetical protein
MTNQATDRTQSTPPQAVGSSDGLGLLVKRLRECVTMKHETALMQEAAAQLEAARAVGVLQEQIIMGHKREIARLRAALQRIARWHGELPESGRQWPDGQPMSYAAAFGSNGERDYMRQVALDALGPNDLAHRPLAVRCSDVLGSTGDGQR